MTEILEIIEQKKDLAKALLVILEEYQNVQGVEKLVRKIKQEIVFFEKLEVEPIVDERKVKCSNLTAFEHLVKAVTKYRNPQNILHPIRNNSLRTSLKIDLVADNGGTWIKTIARNAESIIDTIEGRGEYGAKSILDHADDYLVVSKENFYMFNHPKLVFDFSNDIDEDLRKELEEMGINVVTPSISLQEITIEAESEGLVNEQYTKLNLDITTLIAYVSELTNGVSFFNFKEPLLTEQNNHERKQRVKPILDQFFDKAQTLICCETAAKAFLKILDLLGGPNEKLRGNELLSRLEILPDVENPEQLLNLTKSAQVKQRSLLIFAFGKQNRAMTVTSNMGFIRSAKMQNVDVPAIIHPARALTEQKQTTATRLDEDELEDKS